jgi:hypothetical protein
MGAGCRIALSGLAAISLAVSLVSTSAAASSPTITALSVSPAAPRLADALRVEITVDGADNVARATFFMCILSPKSLCYLPDTMEKDGSRFTLATRPLRDYPETSSQMDIGIKFYLNTSEGDLKFPKPGTQEDFGFEVATTSADPTGAYYKIRVKDEAPVQQPKPIPSAGLPEIALAAGSAGLLAMSLVRRRESFPLRIS